MLQQNMGWFANIFGSVLTSMDESVNGDPNRGLVGRRKRSTRWDARPSSPAFAARPAFDDDGCPVTYASYDPDYEGVPPECAMVLAGGGRGEAAAAAEPERVRARARARA